MVATCRLLGVLLDAFVPNGAVGMGIDETVSLMLLTRIPWANLVWALPCLTVLAPSERSYQVRGRQPLSRLDPARQALEVVRRRVPARELVVVGKHTDAVIDRLDAVRPPVCVITRLRLDAALDEPAPPHLCRPTLANRSNV